jgi:TIR domain
LHCERYHKHVTKFPRRFQTKAKRSAIKTGRSRDVKRRMRGRPKVRTLKFEAATVKANPLPGNDTPIPEVFVLWHPSCQLGETLARRIHGWLRPGNGLGPQVFYRSTKGTDAPVAGCLPFPLPGEVRPPATACTPTSRVTNVQIVLPLIDENMVADPAWREWLVRLGKESPPLSRRVFPVALDTTAFNIPPPVRDLNFLRPSGLPLPIEVGFPPEGLEAVVRSLLKQLTETLCSFMLGGQKLSEAGAPAEAQREDGVPKLKVFLSHAKADGTIQARRLRDYIYSQTQLAAFYDENDIAFGSVFSRVLEKDLGSRETAALIVIRSARYASRPWCRRELSLFRQPHLQSVAESGGERWRLYPTLVVDALEGGKQTEGIPELGNSPCLRWGEAPDQEEQIVTTILRDVMLAAFHSAVAASIPVQPNQIILNWIPDPITLLQIERVRTSDAELKIIHPGRGLSWLELDTLDDLFPHLTFSSFEEVRSEVPP